MISSLKYMFYFILSDSSLRILINLKIYFKYEYSSLSNYHYFYYYDDYNTFEVLFIDVI